MPDNATRLIEAVERFLDSPQTGRGDSVGVWRYELDRLREALAAVKQTECPDCDGGRLHPMSNEPHEPCLTCEGTGVYRPPTPEQGERQRWPFDQIDPIPEPTPSEERCPNCGPGEGCERCDPPSEEPKRCPTCESDDPATLIGECADRATRYGEGKRVRLRLVDPWHSPPEEPAERTPEQGERGPSLGFQLLTKHTIPAPDSQSESWEQRVWKEGLRNIERRLSDPQSERCGGSGWVRSTIGRQSTAHGQPCPGCPDCRPSEEPKRCPDCGEKRERGFTCPNDTFHSPPEEPGEQTPEQGERRWRIYKDGDRTEIHGPDAHGGIEVIPAPDPQSAPIGVSAPSPDPYEGLCPHRRDPAECPDCSGERVNVSLTREEAKFALSYFWGDNAMAARLQAALRAALDSEAPAGGSE
jgi:hypothetical protein